MTFKNKKITFGNVDLPIDEFEPKNVKIRITTMLDESILNALKVLAKKNGQKYQTLINSILKNFIQQNLSTRNPRDFEARVRKIVRDELKKRA